MFTCPYPAYPRTPHDIKIPLFACFIRFYINILVFDEGMCYATPKLWTQSYFLCRSCYMTKSSVWAKPLVSCFANGLPSYASTSNLASFRLAAYWHKPQPKSTIDLAFYFL